MLVNVLKKIFGSRNERLLKQYRKQVVLINEFEPKIQALSDDALRGKTEEFKGRIKNGESLDSILPEAFAVVREASKRVLGMRHFDVQLIGGMALHYGKIAEMRTGEGKTLVATLPSYLNALSGNSVHIVTVNDYLARRDSEWMGRIHQFLGLTVGVNLSQMSHDDKQVAYAADITYGTNNEFGFDYLRDNMVTQISERVQRGLHFAIVDEVDSILIDEARTPLIISGQADDSTALYEAINKLVPSLKKQETEESSGHYNVDLKAHQVLLSEEGHEHAEQLLTEAGLLPQDSSLYDPGNILLIHHLYSGIRAHALYHRDQHYVVQNGEVIIVDEFTGRMMPGRRWSDGLHQAVEAKERVKIQHESQTLASITFQNYFRMYGKLSGMTGTADTEAFEFQQIYNLETIIIPTHKPVARKDFNDQVFQTAREKHNAIILNIKDCYERGQPVLVGTTSIENSELLAQLLQNESLPHQVLNAKQHAKEADIIVQAGRPNMITIATNMAGRGTDIVLGGNPEPEIHAVTEDESLSDKEKQDKIAHLRVEWQIRHNAVISQGGLHIIGSERHESRRIDNQLRGRSGRQGDIGSTRFYLSLQDQLLKIFAADRIAALMQRLKIPEGEAIESPLLTRVIENAQRKVEARNFDIRKQLLEYDDVANEQRQVIYQQRNELLESQDISETIQAMREDRVNTTISQFIPPQSVEEQWDVPALENEIPNEFSIELPLQQWLKEETTLDEEGIRQRIMDSVNKFHTDKFASVDRDVLHHYERAIMLQSLDTHWREHLAALDHLRQGIHLRGYAQKNPKQEYKREAFELFAAMLERIKQDVTKTLLSVQVRSEEEMENVAEEIASGEPDLSSLQYQHAEYNVAEEEDEQESDGTGPAPRPYVRPTDKVGRNDPCPCGSGKKYKQCHGKLN